MNYKVIINIVLRGLTLASKFLLILFLAKFSNTATLGLYGLIVVTINYLVYLIGLDFHTYSTREILSNTKESWPGIIKNQFFLYGVIYVVLFPLIYIIFFLNILPKNIAWLFYSILIAEHIAQEFNRLLIALNKILIASIVLFFRSGFWCFIAIGIINFKIAQDDLVTVLVSWLAGGVISIIIGLKSLSELNLLNIIQEKINWNWIKKGISTALIFMMGSLCLKAINTADRYLIDYLSGVKFVGIYTFYFGISNAFLQFIEASVVAFNFPRIVQSYKSNDIKLFFQLRNKMFMQIMLVIICFSAAALLFMPTILSMIGKEIYRNYINYFWVLIFANYLIVISYIPHYSLYAMEEDKTLTLINVVGLIIFFLSVFLLSIVLSGFESVVYSVLAVSIFFLVGKQWAYFIKAKTKSL